MLNNIKTNNTEHRNQNENFKLYHENQTILTDKTVLIVEDNKIFLQTNTDFLKKLGCKVKIAEYGQKALDLFNSTIDIVLLDIGLPDISGFEVIEKLKSKNTNKVPIIAVTANDISLKPKCIDAGFSDFAEKPLLFEELKKLLIHWLTKN